MKPAGRRRTERIDQEEVATTLAKTAARAATTLVQAAAGHADPIAGHADLTPLPLNVRRDSNLPGIRTSYLLDPILLVLIAFQPGGFNLKRLSLTHNDNLVL